MQKWIPIEQLRVGMYVTRLDKPWMKTPFWFHRMRISSTDQIEALGACGVRSVEIDTEKGLDPPARAGIVANVDPPVDLVAELSPKRGPGAGGASPAPSASEFSEDLRLARGVYRETKSVVQQAMLDVRMGRAIEMEAVSRVVERMVESILHNQEALSSLSRLKSFDEYTFFHSVNTAVLALAMGQSLGMPRGTLLQLGLGTLLHDIGKMKVPLEVLNRPARLEWSEREIVKTHVLQGVEVLLSSTVGLSDQALRPALEHHERVDGTGYPYGKRRAALSQFGLIGAVVDIYDAITSDRVYHKGILPHQALRQLHGLALEGNLDLQIVRAFVQVVGLYPVGTCVMLSTGEIGVVSRLDRAEPLKPTLLLIRDPAGSPISPPRTFELAAQSGPPVRSIEVVLNPQKVGVNPNDFLDNAA